MTFKSYAFSLIFSLLVFQLNAQQLTFESSRELFLHPRVEAGFSYPFLPFDYNSDSLVDFIGSTFNDQFVYKGQADSTYEVLDIYQGQSQSPLKVMDFDKDGDDDVIMERYINLYAEQDSFTFFDPEISFQEEIVEVADFDGNGLNDLLTKKTETFANGTVIIHFQEEDGSFTSVPLQNDYKYGAIDIGDIDNDDDLDILVMLQFESAPAVIFINQGERNFSAADLEAPIDFIGFPISLTGRSIDLEDLDEDGDLDLITHDDFDIIYIFENVDTFQTMTSYYEEYAFDILFTRMADMDNDGDLDMLALTNQNDNFQVKYAINQGDFDFTSLREIYSFPSHSLFGVPNPNYLKNNLLAYDFDHDGKLDIILTDGFSDQSRVLLFRNTTEITTGVFDRGLETLPLTVFPNPASRQLHVPSSIQIQFGTLNYFIIAADGRVMDKGSLKEDGVDISNLSPGSYHFFLQGTGNRQTETFHAHFIKAGH